MHYYYGNMSGFGLFGGILMLLFWLAAISLIIWAVRGFGMSRHHYYQMQDSFKALDILKERYAKGEIDKQEFETKKKDLLGGQ
ncbi:MAG: electron transporter RnfE [Candidatus Kerfeldbacteria bacterium CG08_land_8_20_14_0_20_43_14]|uniref:Electron transporter RnfE n=1 Tax=Candidatus Kerfeldbacteria bacterium CG08_land_8_20_14_0_20_43_14 TaxID=2014246 RepID=A0A2H0YQL1_9BACT|nr:MAG: electron transporter RnfE [Candidatus Kerfeldbacteria bacterium CG08_land_8_20_14_0_20_43_14]